MKTAVTLKVTRKPVCFVFLLMIFSLLPLNGQAQTANAGTTNAQAAGNLGLDGFYGRPRQMRDLTDFDLIDGSDLTEAQKTEVLLSWLVQERAHPTPTTTGLGGGPITSDYIQSQIVIGMTTDSDLTAVRAVLAAKPLHDEGLRDAMHLVLGGMDDQGQVPELERILLHNPNPYFRVRAAEYLYLLGSTASIPALERALKDPYSNTFASHSHGGKITTFYPVRQMAEQTLRNFRTPQILALKKEREDYRKKWKEEARKKEAVLHPHAPPLSAAHFVRIANGEETGN